VFHTTINRHTWVLLISTLLIVLGIFFRLANLDNRAFWNDEVFSALRISGYTVEEVSQSLYKTPEFSFADLQQYLRPNTDKGVYDVIKSLAAEEPHLPLLYFILLRFWAQIVGGSVAIIRGFSVFCGILSFPAMYWLCLELFRSRFVAVMGMTLIAVSPFFVVYSQNARFYGPWALIILLSSAVLLRSLRQPTKLNWGLYAITVAMGLYMFMFHAFVVIGQGIYVLVIEHFRLSKKLTYYLLAVIFAATTFIPWLQILLSNASQAEEMTSHVTNAKTSLVSLIPMWVGGMSRLIVDFGFGFGDSLQTVLPAIPLILGAILFILYSLYFLYRHTPLQVGLFVLIAIATPFLCYLSIDLIISGRFSGSPRYLTAVFIGLELAMAYTLATHLKGTDLTATLPKQSVSTNLKLAQPFKLSKMQSQFWVFLTIVMFTLNVLSCSIRLPKSVWWDRGSSYYTRNIPEIADQINQVKDPLVITDDGFIQLVTLAYELKPEARFQLLALGSSPILPSKDRNIFLFRPSQSLLQQLERQLQAGQNLEPVPAVSNELYKLDLLGS
jgi:uncharacterized membrane protein